jgi:hypothetical protein
MNILLFILVGLLFGKYFFDNWGYDYFQSTLLLFIGLQQCGVQEVIEYNINYPKAILSEILS